MLALMRRTLLVSVFALLVALVPNTESAAAPPPPLAYVERTIAAPADAKLPLVVVMHGLGSSPEEILSLLDGFDVPVRVIAPRAPDRWEVGTSWYPIDEPARATAVVQRRAAAVVALTAAVARARPTRGKPIVTGFSQGGVLSFALAAYHPAKLTAALPIAGMLRATSPAFRKAPAGFRLIALHGQDDQRIPFAQAEATVARLQKVGTRASLEGFEGVGHTVSPAMLARFHGLLREQLANVGK